ncbi:MAG: cupin domain-containing protein [Candidatus Limnocylindrales bacterium]
MPQPRATTAAWLASPPVEVSTPAARAMPWTSSGDVSARTKITVRPASAASTAASGEVTISPQATPGDAARPVAMAAPTPRRSVTSVGGSARIAWTRRTASARVTGKSGSSAMSRAIRSAAWGLRLPTRHWSIHRRPLAAIGAVAIVASVALAGTIAPPATLSQSVQVNRDGIKFQTKEATDFTMGSISFAPGANSGWHHHPGIIWVLVEQGQVTISDENCHTTTYSAGQVFLEGGDEPMLASNLGTTTAVVYNTQVVPHGDPFKIPDQAPACAAG